MKKFLEWLNENVFKKLLLLIHPDKVQCEEYNTPMAGMKSRWSMGYKKKINCSHPNGFSQKNYCKRQKFCGKYKGD